MVCYFDRSSCGNFLRFHSFQVHKSHSLWKFISFNFARITPSGFYLIRTTVQLVSQELQYWCNWKQLTELTERTHLPRTSLFYFLWPGLAILCSLKVGKSSLDKNGATASYSNTDFKVKLLLLLWMLFDTQITLPNLPRRTILRWKWPSMLGLVLLLADGLDQQQKKHPKKGPRTQSF